MTTKSPWHKSNADMFATNREYFGKTTEAVKIRAINNVDPDAYANNVIGFIRHKVVKYGTVSPDTTFREVLDMLNNSEL